MMCKVLDVSRSGYYAWVDRGPSNHARQDEHLAARIRAIHDEHHERYGSPRIHSELAANGTHVGRKRVARLMQENGLRARPRRRFKRTTDSNHKHPIATNLLGQNFTASRPDEAWVGDITYIWTLEGWVYLAVLLDLYSRRVVGWAMRKSLNRELAIAALSQAILRRRPAPGLLHHTDRGSQYASNDYQELLEQHGIECSMSAAGHCWDNAVAESFFATLKKELVHGCAFFTRTEAYDIVSDYIENYYNPKRRHSANGFISPVEFELMGGLTIAA
jgi:transposase InsO family protein